MIVNKYFTSEILDIKGVDFMILQDDKPSGDYKVESFVFGVGEENARDIARFILPTTEAGEEPSKKSQVVIKARKLDGNDKLFMFAKVYLLTKNGFEKDIAFSEAVEIDIQKDYILGLDMPTYKVDSDSYLCVKLYAFRTGGGGRLIIQLEIDNSSRFTYTIGEEDGVTVTASNVAYSNAESGLEADNLQEAVDLLAKGGADIEPIPIDFIKGLF